MLIFMRSESEANKRVVNGILLHHNIEKQMSDSRGEVAYLMADISAVKEGEIRDLFQSLEELSCMYTRRLWIWEKANSSSVHPNTSAVLGIPSVTGNG
jgi:D-3-phosphoglycerate dehydrogenase